MGKPSGVETEDEVAKLTLVEVNAEIQRCFEGIGAPWQLSKPKGIF